LMKYVRLLHLIDRAEVVLEQLKEVKSYENIKTKVLGWWNNLWDTRKTAISWVKENAPKNNHQNVVVPDNIYFPLLEQCVGYSAELNDSYKEFKSSIRQETEQLKAMYEKNEEESFSDEDDENPLSKPKWLYRWVSTEEASQAKKQGITFYPEGGGIPTSTKGAKGIAITSGAVNLSKLLTIDTSKIPGFKFEYVSTRSKLKEVKIKCDVPATAIQ